LKKKLGNRIVVSDIVIVKCHHCPKRPHSDHSPTPSDKKCWAFNFLNGLLVENTFCTIEPGLPMVMPDQD
jgi:hypothetical protein